MTIKAITAFGTRGLEDVLFIAKPDRTGRYVLNKKQPSNAKHPTNKAVNKVYARVLGENRPARAVIPCGKLHYGFLIEIEAIAATDQPV